ncbi:hypothetical protein MHK_010103, partial [Candidatus Magnetomorum sp. HK-1]
NLGERNSGLPLILCIIVIYNEYERTRRKDRKFNQKINKQLIDQFSYISLPELSDIHKDEIPNWQKKDFVCKYLVHDDLSELQKMYKKTAYKNGMPMNVLADEIKNRYFS